jgi:hypothetical protein
MALDGRRPGSLSGAAAPETPQIGFRFSPPRPMLPECGTGEAVGASAIELEP